MYSLQIFIIERACHKIIIIRNIKDFFILLVIYYLLMTFSYIINKLESVYFKFPKSFYYLTH